MIHFGIVCPPITGHVNPLAALGRTLIGRSHRVTLLHVQDMESRALAEGLEFAALGCRDHPPGTLAQSVRELSELTGLSSLKFAVQCAVRISGLILENGPDVMRREKINAVLVYQIEPSPGSVAEH